MFITKAAETLEGFRYSFVASEALDELLLSTTKTFKDAFRFVFCNQPAIRFYIISAPEVASLYNSRANNRDALMRS
jgi:hypothetical protein